MLPKKVLNSKFTKYSLIGCPLTDKGQVCSYSGFCVNCPFRLLLNVANTLHGTSESHTGIILRNILLNFYGF